MRAFRFDTSTQGEQQLHDAESWAWRESRTKSGQLLLPCEWRGGVVRGSGWRSGGLAFFRALPYSPQLAAVRRSPPQPAAARRSPPQREPRPARIRDVFL